MMHRLIALTVAGAALLMSACAGATSSAINSEQPLPTIGLGSEIGDDGKISGGADALIFASAEIDTLVMVGDSITVASTPALEEIFARLGFDNVVIQAQSSKRTASGGQSNPSGADVAASLVNLIESTEPGQPNSDPSDHSNELWVVALGTNDITQYPDPAQRAGAIDEMLNSVPDESIVVWVDTYWRDRSDATAELNDTIADRVRQRGNSVIAEWSAVAADDGNLRDDGVHPREQGSIVFANVVGNTILEFLQLN
jgi:lysophospholipase L1-like esterase